MTKDEFKSLEACGYGGLAPALRQAQATALRQAHDCADAVKLPGAWVQPATQAYESDVGWLWRNVLAVNKITVVAGAAGIGKSLLVAADLAARVSAGSASLDRAPGKAADVLIASGNDWI